MFSRKCTLPAQTGLRSCLPHWTLCRPPSLRFFGLDLQVKTTKDTLCRTETAGCSFIYIFFVYMIYIKMCIQIYDTYKHAKTPLFCARMLTVYSHRMHRMHVWSIRSFWWMTLLKKTPWSKIYGNFHLFLQSSGFPNLYLSAPCCRLVLEPTQGLRLLLYLFSPDTSLWPSNLTEILCAGMCTCQIGPAALSTGISAPCLTVWCWGVLTLTQELKRL